MGVEKSNIGNSGDGGKGKKTTVKLFGHEFDRKKAVMAGLGGLLALALVVGGIAYAASQQTKGGGEPQPIVQTEKKDKAEQEWVVQLGAKADGWEKDKSSPVIAHIVSESEGIDYYHAYDANATEVPPVHADGDYEVSFIAPVNADGSTYKAPEEGSAAADADNHNKMVNLPYTFEPLKAEDMKEEDISGILSAVNEAVKKGDETLTGENGVKAVELVEKNLKANPNADKEKVAAEADKAADGAQGAGEASDKGAKGTGGTGSTGGSNSGSSPSGNGNSNANSGSGSGSNKPSHTHNWVAQTTTVHHDAQYRTDSIYHPAVIEYHTVCNSCGSIIDGHAVEHLESSDTCESYTTNKEVIISNEWYEEVQTLVREAWDETVTTGYKCSCGATK